MKNQIEQLLQSILNAPLLHQINSSDQQKLMKLTEKPKQRLFLFNLLKQTLQQSQSVFIRLKILLILQNFISSHHLEENLQQINLIITSHERRVRRNCQKMIGMKEITKYIQSEVQLPFTILLRKMIYWQNHEDYKNASDISLGFSLINKMKEILQLKKMFHTYDCYYSSHKYAINMFKQSLSAARKLWQAICYLVKNVIVQITATNAMLQEQFLLISAAEEIQQSLIEFIWTGYFSKKIRKDEKIKKIEFLTPYICELQNGRKKRLNQKKANECLHSKRQNMKLASNISYKKTRESQMLQQKINTQMEVQILDSILKLQSLINL